MTDALISNTYQIQNIKVGHHLERSSNGNIYALGGANAGGESKLFRSTDNGATWVGYTLLSSGTVRAHSLVTDGNFVHIVYSASGGTLKYRKFDSDTVSLGSEITIASNNGTDQWSASIIGTNNNLRVYYKDNQLSSNLAIRRAVSTNGGASWSDSVIYTFGASMNTGLECHGIELTPGDDLVFINRRTLASGNRKYVCISEANSWAEETIVFEVFPWAIGIAKDGDNKAYLHCYNTNSTPNTIYRRDGINSFQAISIPWANTGQPFSLAVDNTGTVWLFSSTGTPEAKVVGNDFVEQGTRSLTYTRQTGVNEIHIVPMFSLDGYSNNAAQPIPIAYRSTSGSGGASYYITQPIEPLPTPSIPPEGPRRLFAPCTPDATPLPAFWPFDWSTEGLLGLDLGAQAARRQKQFAGSLWDRSGIISFKSYQKYGQIFLQGAFAAINTPTSLTYSGMTQPIARPYAADIWRFYRDRKGSLLPFWCPEFHPRPHLQLSSQAAGGSTSISLTSTVGLTTEDGAEGNVIALSPPERNYFDIVGISTIAGNDIGLARPLSCSYATSSDIFLAYKVIFDEPLKIKQTHRFVDLFEMKFRAVGTCRR